MSYFISNNN